ncbi:DUF6933 domain-containing protein [Micromonospora thermarum]|uniref:DUF6933 domain-containing protein n=1 Tax=Micromonospora thermarum TaxID=2720024 RepID=A0ABX0ZD39_9ACTN|nr:hypothetical protein [Micromonospora thermarum]NJP35845.1 hypothetical protein [Micromonospora thermarum]
MLIVRATKKLLDHINPPRAVDGDQDTTLLGPWYATALFWRLRLALLVNERTLLPVLLPLAPAHSFPGRIPNEIATVLDAHQMPEAFISDELQNMQNCRFATTANRSVVGIMNEFTNLAKIYTDDLARPDLVALSLRLATTPCSPLYAKNVSPDRELAALVRSTAN